MMDKNKLMSDVDLGVVMTGLDALLGKPGRRVELPLKGMRAVAATDVVVCLLSPHVHGASCPFVVSLGGTRSQLVCGTQVGV